MSGLDAGSDSARDVLQILRGQRLNRRQPEMKFDASDLTAYQEKVFKLFADFPEVQCTGKACLEPLADAFFVRRWKSQYKEWVAQTGSVLIPLAWKALTDDYPWNRSKSSMNFRVKLGKAWQKLDHRRSHFTIMMQSNVGQVLKAFRANRLGMLDFSSVIVFDSRGNDTLPAFPIPLLHEKVLPVSTVSRNVTITFRGSCNDRGAKVRHAFPELFRGFPGAMVLSCGSMSRNFSTELQASVFALCAPGSFGTSFRQYEALQAGALPVIVSDSTYPGGSLWLPFQDLGVDWNEIGLVIQHNDLSNLPKSLENLLADPASVRQRQARAAAVAPLFTPQGLLEYVLYVLSFYNTDNLRSDETAVDAPPDLLPQSACLAGALARRAQMF